MYPHRFVLKYREKDSRKTTLIVATSVFAFLTLLNTSKGLTPLQPTVVWLIRSTSSGPHLPVQVPVAKLLVWPSTLIPPLLLHHDPQRFISHARPGYVFSTAMARVELGCSNPALPRFPDTWDKKSDSTEQFSLVRRCINPVDTSGLRRALCDLRAWRRSLWRFEA